MTAFANNPDKQDDAMEQLGELIEGCLQEEGYKVTNFMDTNTTTTAYGGMFIRLYDGREVTLHYGLVTKRRDSV